MCVCMCFLAVCNNLRVETWVVFVFLTQHSNFLEASKKSPDMFSNDSSTHPETTSTQKTVVLSHRWASKYMFRLWWHYHFLWPRVDHGRSCVLYERELNGGNKMSLIFAISLENCFISQVMQLSLERAQYRLLSLLTCNSNSSSELNQMRSVQTCFIY
jgi:hypothetical protein